MKKNTLFTILLLIMVMLFGCSKTSKHNQVVTCPMCSGSGVFCLMPDDIFAPRNTCAACNGTGMCTVEQADNIRDDINQANAFINNNEINTPQRSGRSAYEIQRDLDKAYRLLADMERQYKGVFKCNYCCAISINDSEPA